MLLNNLKATLPNLDEIDNLFGGGYRATAVLSDFAIIRGAFYSSPDSKGDMNGYYWTSKCLKKPTYNDMFIFYQYSGNEAYYYDFIGSSKMGYVAQRNIGCRPVLTYSNLTFNSENINKDENSGLLEIEYGYYPQSIANNDIQRILESGYKNNVLVRTKNKYTIDSISYKDTSTPFSKEEIIEYEYNEERYVRVKANGYDKKYSNGDFIWIKVEPIKWLVEPGKQRIISKKILLAGIQFNNSDEIENGFEESNIKKFLNAYFLKEITQNMNLEKKYDDRENGIARIKNK